MNRKFLAVLAVSAMTVVACKKENKETNVSETTEVVAESTAVEGTVYNVELADSKVEWEGSKVSGDRHEGTLGLQSGTFVVNEGSLVGGSLVFDMNSITVTDLTDAEKKGMLEGHLKGLGDDAESKDHFFNVEKFPTATFDITKVTQENGKHKIEGNLTLKDKTNPVSFLADVKVEEDKVSFESDNIVFDRTQWNVNFNSGSVVKDLAADKIIKDEIKLEAKIVAKK